MVKERTVVKLGIWGCLFFSICFFFTSSVTIFASVFGKETINLQTLSSIAAAGLTGIAAFATLGTLLHLVKEKMEEKEKQVQENILRNFELYKKHKEEFVSLLKRIQGKEPARYFHRLPEFVFVDPSQLYHEIFPENSYLNITLEYEELPHGSLLKRLIEDLMFLDMAFMQLVQGVGRGTGALKMLTSFYERLKIVPIKVPEEEGVIFLGGRATVLNLFALDQGRHLIQFILTELLNFVGGEERFKDLKLEYFNNPISLHQIYIRNLQVLNEGAVFLSPYVKRFKDERVSFPVKLTVQN